MSAQSRTKRTAPERTWRSWALRFVQWIWTNGRVLFPARAGYCAVALLVAVGVGIVHAERSVRVAYAAAGDGETRSAPKERAFHGALPENVIEMREEILAAFRTGRIAALAKAAQWSESKSGRALDFGGAPEDDMGTHWARMSADGAGAEVLAIAADLLALPPARLAIGKDPENTFVYVWPYLAELPPGELTAPETVDLLRLVPNKAAKDMRKKGMWTWWRLAIAADGTWLVFRRYP